MSNLLVLGLIPGTNIAISFQAWLIIMGCLPFAARWARPHVEKQLNKAVITAAFCFTCLFGFRAGANTISSLI